MNLLIDIILGFLAYLLANYVLHLLGMNDPLAVVLAIVVGIVVFLQHPSARLNG